MRKIRFLILFCLLGALLALPALADSGISVLDGEELDELLSPSLERWGASDSNFGLAFYYSGTGETYYLHPEAPFYSASLYKVPVCMRYAELVSQGELSWDERIAGRELDELVRLTLVNSSNDTAGALVLHDTELCYGHRAFGLYSGYSEEEQYALESKYTFTPRYVLNTFLTLYQQSERFPRVLDYLSEAAPGSFFRSKLDPSLEVAQKYGQYEGVLHTAGVIGTPHPIILVVMCGSMKGQLEAIEDLAVFFADYALTLDGRMEAEEERLRAEQEQEEAKRQQRLAEEEQLREQAQQEALDEQARQEAEARQQAKRQRENLMITAILTLSAVCAVTALLLRKKKA